jgi:hypothetical protein
LERHSPRSLLFRSSAPRSCGSTALPRERPVARSLISCCITPSPLASYIAAHTLALCSSGFTAMPCALKCCWFAVSENCLPLHTCAHTHTHTYTHTHSRAHTHTHTHTHTHVPYPLIFTHQTTPLSHCDGRDRTMTFYLVECCQSSADTLSTHTCTFASTTTASNFLSVAHCITPFFIETTAMEAVLTHAWRTCTPFLPIPLHRACSL